MFPVRLVQLSLAGMALILANAAAAPDHIPKGAGDAGFWANGKLARIASDATFLAAVKGEPRLAVLASGALGSTTLARLGRVVVCAKATWRSRLAPRLEVACRQGKSRSNEPSPTASKRW